MYVYVDKAPMNSYLIQCSTTYYYHYLLDNQIGPDLAP